HRPRHLRDAEDVPFCHRLVPDEPERVLRHPDAAFGHRTAGRRGLAADVHHAGPPLLIQVRELHERPPPAKSSVKTAVRSCGFTLHWASSRASSTRVIAAITLLVSPPSRASSRRRSRSASSIEVNAPRA